MYKCRADKLVLHTTYSGTSPIIAQAKRTSSSSVFVLTSTSESRIAHNRRVLSSRHHTANSHPPAASHRANRIPRPVQREGPDVGMHAAGKWEEISNE